MTTNTALRASLAGPTPDGPYAAAARLCGDVTRGTVPPPVDARRIACRRTEQVEEVALDPFAREVVRDGDHERVAVDLRPRDLAEPGLEGRVIQGLSQPSRDVVPDPFRRQLDLLVHACCTLLRSTLRGREHSSVSRPAQ